MKFGVWTPLPHAIRAEPEMTAAIADVSRAGAAATPDKSLAFAVETLREAEKLGFETSLVAERLLGPDLEAWMLAAALAANTKTIELIVAVHPGIFSAQVTAKMAATLDRISDGRAAVNIVNGWWQEEFENYGNGAWLPSSDDRYQRMREFMQVLHGMWSEPDGFSFDGTFYKTRDVRLPTRTIQQYPPIYAASSSPDGREMIAEFGDCWFTFPVMPRGYLQFDTLIAGLKAQVDDIRERAANHGRTIRIGVTGHVIACETDEEAHERALELEEYGKQSMMNVVVASATGSGFVGSYETVAKRFLAYEDIGFDTAMLHFHPMIEGMRSFMANVVPLMKQARAAELRMAG